MAEESSAGADASIAVNAEKNQVIHYENGQWVKVQHAINDKTGEAVAYYNGQWRNIGKWPKKEPALLRASKEFDRPFTELPGEVMKANREAIEQLKAAGPALISGKPEEMLGTGLLGGLGGLAGTMGMAPVEGAVRSLATKPLERATGIPERMTTPTVSAAATLPGLGLKLARGLGMIGKEAPKWAEEAASALKGAKPHVEPTVSGETSPVADVREFPPVKIEGELPKGDGIEPTLRNLRPIRLYHGTRADFEHFERGKGIGPHFGTLEQAHSRVGGEEAAQEEISGTNIRAVDLFIKNPLRLGDGGWENPLSILDNLWRYKVIDDAEHAEFVRRFVRGGITDKRSQADKFQWLRDKIREKGYDSIVYDNNFDGVGDSYIPLNWSAQVKPALRVPEKIPEAAGKIDPILGMADDLEDVLRAAQRAGPCEEAARGHARRHDAGGASRRAGSGGRGGRQECGRAGGGDQAQGQYRGSGAREQRADAAGARPAGQAVDGR